MAKTKKLGDLVNQTVTLSAPLSGTANLVDPLNFSITKANTTTDGYVSAIDWNIFNNKQDALGFTPYNATNPDGYISGITSGMVTTALGFTPYDSANPSGYITSSALSTYVPYTGATTNLNLGTFTLRVGNGTVSNTAIQLGATANLGLYSSSANKIDFVTQGLVRMSINADGTVVMGTATTNVIGNTYLDYGTNATGVRFTATTLTLSTGTGSPGTGVNYMRMFQTGNIVIQNGGTFTDAGYRLDVNGTARFQGNISLTQTVTTETVTSNKTVTIVINGTTYKLLAV